MDLTERYIDRQVELLKSKPPLPSLDPSLPLFTNAGGIDAPLPEEINEALERIGNYAPSLYKRHFLGYMNFLRTGDLNGSLLSLRRYFDYSIKNRTTSPVQYSALNLAALHTRLNYPSKALAVITQSNVLRFPVIFLSFHTFGMTELTNAM